MELTITDFLACFLGWFILNSLIWNYTKNKYDTKKETYSFKEHKKENIDDWIFTFSAALGLLIIAPDVFIYISIKFEYMKDVFWNRGFPLVIGFAGGFTFQALYSFLKTVSKAVTEKTKKLIEKWTS
jgi:hypothetical protein